MRIAVYGGTGVVGSAIVAEAASRGHQVHVIARRRPDTGTAPTGDLPTGASFRLGDASDGDDVARVASGHDVVVSAIGPSRTGGRAEDFLAALATLAANVGTRRLVVVGGAGSLFVAPGLRLLDTAGFPPEYLHEARAGLAALQQFKRGGGFVDWVYVSPAPELSPGERTGRYQLGSDMVVGDHISIADYAVALVDEIEKPAHRREQFCVSA
jgi:putative NADH-flavin reductase